MNRRAFLSTIVSTRAASYLPRTSPRTAHLIFIHNAGGVRRRDYYEDPVLAQNVRRIAREGFVFEEDHCESVASHDAAFAELMTGREQTSGGSFPTVLDYVGNGVQSNSIETVPLIMERHRPRIFVCRHAVHDVGHDTYEGYLQSVHSTDVAIGKLFDWVNSHPYFSHNTAIVIRPEFGRDDTVNVHGHLHHSYGFYSTHRVASIFWGPDFNRGIDRETVITSHDFAPTLTRVFGVDAVHARGRVVPGLFKAF